MLGSRVGGSGGQGERLGFQHGPYLRSVEAADTMLTQDALAWRRWVIGTPGGRPSPYWLTQISRRIQRYRVGGIGRIRLPFPSSSAIIRAFSSAPLPIAPVSSPPQ